jgi:hypothetical protein
VRGVKTTLLGRPEKFENRTRFSDSIGWAWRLSHNSVFFRARDFVLSKSQSLSESNSDLILRIADGGLPNPKSQNWKWKIGNVGL